MGQHQPLRSIEERNALALANKGLIGHSIKLFNRGRLKIPVEEFDDAFSIAFIGLLRCAELWDESKHNKFSTYAVPAILRRLAKWVETGGVVAYPAYLFRKNIRNKKGPVYKMSWQDDVDVGLFAACEQVKQYSQDDLDELHGMLLRLPAKDYEAIDYYFLRGWTFRQMGSYLGMTPEGARKIVIAAVNRLRALYGVKNPKQQ